MVLEQRGDQLLRAVVATLEAAGYRPAHRQTRLATTTVGLQMVAPDHPACPQALQVTHVPAHHCLQLELDPARPGRTIYWYYQVHDPQDLAHIVEGLAATAGVQVG